MNTGDSAMHGNDSDLQAGGSDDGDFDLSGFAGGDYAPGTPKAGDSAGKGPKGPAKGPKAPRAAGAGPRAGGYEKGPRSAGPGPRAGGYDKAPRAPRGFDRAPREGGPRSYDRAPRDGGPRPFDKGPRAAGPGGGRFGGPREGGPRGFDRAPRGMDGASREGKPGFKKDFAPRGDRPFAPRGDRPAGPRGDRPFAPRGDRDRTPGDRPRPYHTKPVFPPVPAGAGVEAKPVSPEVRPWLVLKNDKGRWKESRFLLEGAKNIADALAVSPAMIHMAFVAEDFKDKALLLSLKKNRVATVPVSADDIRGLSDTEAPQGIVAVCNFATLKPDWNKARYVTLLDAVQDPGNVGAILRTSAALGMDALVLGKGSCDPYNPKVVRSSVGALLGLPFETGEELGSKISFLRQKGFSVVATSSHAKETLEQAKLRKKVALIVGNEGAGTGASYLDMADAVVKIPLKKVESLNVAVAHGILSYQLIHGRE